eukprot:CAMPEP_0118946594 /NCGR_PEP_ID=MMETSP1169-20130426/44466_1 /TAXON_ID=36882 /ORGANISM="Pyramimonas obovata, Strain CCMP722" /LENGTH=246 /DNA_ID=CAMNT_0006892601 /DNA_START=202 /DNA_END=938 /DNA_ORIENTATION=-
MTADELVQAVLASQAQLQATIGQSVDACASDLEAMHQANSAYRRKLEAAAVERTQLTEHVRELTARLQQAEDAQPDVEQIKLLVSGGAEDLKLLKQQAELIRAGRAAVLAKVEQCSEDVKSMDINVDQLRRENEALRDQAVQVLADRVSLKEQVQAGQEEVLSLRALAMDCAAEREALKADMMACRLSFRTQLEEAVAETRKLQQQLQQGANSRASLKALVENGLSEMREFHQEVQQRMANELVAP